MKRLDAFAILIPATLVIVAFENLGYPEWLRDAVRAMELAEAAVIIVITALIVRRYFKNFRADPTKARLLPRHVIGLGIGTLGLTVTASAFAISRIGEPFVWYGASIAFPSLTALLIGLVDMVRWLPNRTAPPVNDHRRATDSPQHNEK